MITLKVKNWTNGLISYISRITEAKRQSQRIKCQLCYLEASTSSTFIECNVHAKIMTKSVLTFNLQVARLAFEMSQFQSVAGHLTAVEPLLMRALGLKVGDSFLVSI